jgi:hypothetical protein
MAEFFVFNGEEGFLEVDNTNPVPPKRLRTCNDPYIPERVAELQTNGIPIPSRDGLSDIRISGSSQFGRRGLNFIVERVMAAGADRANIVVCDLRGEPHMILNGFPVSWYNKGDKIGANLPPVQSDELNRRYVQSIANHTDVTVYDVHAKEDGLPTHMTGKQVPVLSIQTEEMLVHREFHLGYQRVPITDHERPEISDADMLVSFYQSTTPSTWWHFHCAGGMGRTTTAMVVIDMMRNRHRFPHLTLEDFLLRHYLIGGANLYRLDDSPEKLWKLDDAKDRVAFLDLVYQYAHDAKAHQYGLMFFSSWLAYSNNHLPW